MAVNRAVSSHLDRVGLPGLTSRTRRSWGRTGGRSPLARAGIARPQTESCGVLGGHGPRLLYQLRWVFISAIGRESLRLTGRTGARPTLKSIQLRRANLLGTHPLQWLLPSSSQVKLARLPI